MAKKTPECARCQGPMTDNFRGGLRCEYCGLEVMPPPPPTEGSDGQSAE